MLWIGKASISEQGIKNSCFCYSDANQQFMLIKSNFCPSCPLIITKPCQCWYTCTFKLRHYGSKTGQSSHDTVYIDYINLNLLDIKHGLLNASLNHLAFEIYCCLLHTWHVKLHQSEAWHDLANVQQCRILFHKQSTYMGGCHYEYSYDLGIQAQ